MFKFSSQPHVKFPNKHHIKRIHYIPGIVLTTTGLYLNWSHSVSTHTTLTHLPHQFNIVNESASRITNQCCRQLYFLCAEQISQHTRDLMVASQPGTKSTHIRCMFVQNKTFPPMCHVRSGISDRQTLGNSVLLFTSVQGLSHVIISVKVRYSLTPYRLIIKRKKGVLSA